MLNRWLTAALLLIVPASASSLALPKLDDAIAIPATENGIALSELIAIVQKNLELPILFEPKEVERVNVTFTGDLKVAKSHLLEVFEQLLDDADFVVVERGGAENRLYSIHKVGAQSGRGAVLKSLSMTKSADEVVALGQRTVLVTTMMQCNSIPARELVQVLQPYFADQFIENIRNVEGTNMMVMTGKACLVSRMIQLARDMDARNVESTRPEFEKVHERLQKLESEIAALRSKKPATDAK